MDSPPPPPTNESTNSSEDGLDFLGDLSPSTTSSTVTNTTNTTNTTTRNQTHISNVDLFDSLADFSEIDSQAASDYDKQTAPDLLLDLSSDNPQVSTTDKTNLNSLSTFEVIDQNDLFGDSLIGGTMNSETDSLIGGTMNSESDSLIGGTMNSESDSLMVGTMNSESDSLIGGTMNSKSDSLEIVDANTSGKMKDSSVEELKTDNTDGVNQNESWEKERNMSTVSGDIDQPEINFDVLKLPSSSVLGLTAEHFKSQIAKQGSYALRRKPSRKGVRIILPINEDQLFIDSTEPKPEVISPDEEEPSEISSKTEEGETTLSQKTPPKHGFAMPGLQDLNKSKLFSKSQRKSISEEELSPSNTTPIDVDTKSVDVIKDTKPSAVRVLPTLPSEKPKLNKTGVRVLPMIPSLDKSDEITVTTESYVEAKNIKNKRSSITEIETVVVSEDKETMNDDLKLDTTMLSTDTKKDNKLVTEEDSDVKKVVSPTTSSPGVKSSTSFDSKPVVRREKPPIQDKPNRLSFIKSKDLDPKKDVMTKINSNDTLKDKSVLSGILGKKKTADLKIEIIEKENDDVSEKKSRSSIKNNSSSISDTKHDFTNVELRHRPRDSNNYSKRHSTNLEFLASSTSDKSDKMVKIPEKRSSRNFDLPSTDAQKEPSWLVEMRSKKNTPSSEKNVATRNSSFNGTELSQTKEEVPKQPSWMTEMKARKTNRVKPDADVSKKMTMDQKPEKPAWMKTALDKQSKVAEILNAKENKNQENVNLREKPSPLPEVQLRKPVKTEYKKNRSQKDTSNKNNGETPPWFTDLQLRKTRSSSSKDIVPKDSIEPEWKRKAEEKRARLIKSGFMDHQ